MMLLTDESHPLADNEHPREVQAQICKAFCLLYLNSDNWHALYWSVVEIQGFWTSCVALIIKDTNKLEHRGVRMGSLTRADVLYVKT